MNGVTRPACRISGQAPPPVHKSPTQIREQYAALSLANLATPGYTLAAVAERSGWHVVRVFEDSGISGSKGRDKRPGLDAMLKAVNAREFEMVAAWSVD